jgi:DNA-binding MarR family transcriptional regulator
MQRKQPGFQYEHEVAKIVGALHRKLTRNIYDLFLKGKLSLSHIVTMELLHDRERCNMSELSKALNLTMGASTAVIDKLTSLGLANRQHVEKDRRIVEVFLSKKGARLINRVIGHRLEMVKKVLSVLTDKDKKAYLYLLNKIYKGLVNENA